ncbi:uncharacterized protein ARB_04983 [Trichophyton benhamiae CBS 112371]|uniref:Uncharacterized protein n=1 Tax=Arthroderma benhamiae (strain ATCC MYA-4681 / CBS 112371) TaxID=663331 RepID=D4AKY7_ARTBC|nr:uncharacterized protein ARB_04983 [Trichophyton benhamiae CBS 112371]EFE36046.1 hypothetical protein ARB_04983 [Trichophyton benhamiae CBS 112371]
MGYPTNAEIKSLLESQFHSKLQKSDLTDDSESLFQFGHLDELFSDDVEVHISGHEFHLNGKHRGLDAFKEHLQSDDMPSLNSIIDVNKPIKGSVLHVIGGENDEWKAAVLHSTATTQNSKFIRYISKIKNASSANNHLAKTPHGITRWLFSCASTTMGRSLN